MKVVCRFIFIILSTALIMGCEKKVDLKMQMGSYFAKHNAHDIDQTMKLFADDALFFLPGQKPLNGKAAIRRVESWDSAIDSRLQVKEMKVSGDTVILGQIIERNRWFIVAGIQAVTYDTGTYAVFSDGYITEFHPSRLTQASAGEVSDIFRTFLVWAKQEKPDELAVISPPGKPFQYDASKAEGWINLIREWKESTK
jgi:ketosteroid isomerase-like protein